MTTPEIVINGVPDYTGENPDYLVVNERQNLAEKNSRTFVLNGGPFYNHGLEVTDLSTGRKLKPVEDFEMGILNPLATAACTASYKVFSTLSLTSKWQSLPDLSVTYQKIGGPYTDNVEGLKQVIKDLTSKPTEVYWDQIRGIPIAFPPEYHLHHAKDFYGLDDTVASIYGISTAIEYLADTLARTAVPHDTVVYGGVSKYTIDQGFSVDPDNTTLTLKFPRSKNGNAAVKLNIEFLIDGDVHSMTLTFRESVVDKFIKPRLYCDSIKNLGISNQTVKTHDDFNYFKFDFSKEIEFDGFILVKDVTVRCDKTDEYNGEYEWDNFYPSEGVEKPLQLLDHGEYLLPIKSNVDTGFSVTSKSENLYLRTPNLSNGKFVVTMDFLVDGNNHPVVFSGEVVNGKYENLTLQKSTNVPISAVGFKKKDGWGYLRLTNTNNENGWNVIISKVVCLGGALDRYSGSWVWGISGSEYESSNDIVAVQYVDTRNHTHEHEINEVRGLEARLSNKTEVSTFNQGLGISQETNLNDITVGGHYYLVEATDIALLVSANFPTNLVNTIEDYQNLLINTTRFYGKVKQEIIFNNGYVVSRWLSLNEENETVTGTTEWMYGSNSINQGHLCEPRNYILDLTGYDTSKYYLVEMALSGSDIQKLNNNITGMVDLTLVYNLGDNGAVGDSYGQLFGKLMYGANSNLKTYYSLTALCDDEDDTKYPFHSIWVSHLDAGDLFKCFLWVRGGGKINATYNGEMLILPPKTGEVVVGAKSDGTKIKVTNGAADPNATAKSGWKILESIRPNYIINSVT